MNWFIPAVRKASYVSTREVQRAQEKRNICSRRNREKLQLLGWQRKSNTQLLDKITNDLTTDCTKMTGKSAPGCWFCLVLYYVRIFLRFRNSAACIYSRQLVLGFKGETGSAKNALSQRNRLATRVNVQRGFFQVERSEDLKYVCVRRLTTIGNSKFALNLRSFSRITLLVSID